MLKRSLIEKTFLDIGGFESEEAAVTENTWRLFSFLHPSVKATLQGNKTNPQSGNFVSVLLSFDIPDLDNRIKKQFSALATSSGIMISTETDLENVFRFTASLIKTLPPNLLPRDNEEEYDPINDDLRCTEAEAQARQRRGQEIYKKRLLALWGGKCSVTGVSIPALLRASHAKPWADCKTGSERLNPYNGFLLTANLDALFDQFLISFENDGHILISPTLSHDELRKAGIFPDMKLRFINKKHLPFLEYHRSKFLQNDS